MSLYGYPREPEPSGNEETSDPHGAWSDTFAVPPAPEPPAPLLPADPPGFSPMPPYSNGHGAAPNGDPGSGRIPGQRRVPETEFTPPGLGGPASQDPPGGWQDVTARAAQARPVERGWQDLIARPAEPPLAPQAPVVPPPVAPAPLAPPPVAPAPVSPAADASSSGRHRGGAQEPAPDEGFSWLARPTSGGPAGFGPSPAMGQPAVPAGFGPSPTMGQPAVPFSAPAPPAARPSPVEPPTGPPAAAPVSPAESRLPDPRASAAEIAALLDEPEAVPWDRRPLLIVIATAIVLVLIGVASAFVTAAMVGPSRVASWVDSAAPVGAVQLHRS